MTLEPNEEQALLRDMVTRFLADHIPPEAAARTSMPAADWRTLGELGVLAVAAPEEVGGLGGGPAEIALISEALGRAAAITPLAEVAILSTLVLAGSEATQQRATWLAGLLSGQALVAYAGPGQGMSDLSFTSHGDGWILNGEHRFVRHGDRADAIVVDTGEAGPGLFLIETGDGGPLVTLYRLADGDMAAIIAFDGLIIPSSARLSISPSAHRRAIALAQLSIVAEMIGLMQTLYDATIAYVRERRQFGVAIGSFQVVQHRAARLFVMLEQSRSMMVRAVAADTEAFEMLVTQARAYVSDAALRLAQDATQLHGGMGVTDELLVGRGHRRLLVLSHLFGGAIDARQTLAA